MDDDAFLRFQLYSFKCAYALRGVNWLRLIGQIAPIVDASHVHDRQIFEIEGRYYILGKVFFLDNIIQVVCIF